jgi:hypothetical protein
MTDLSTLIALIKAEPSTRGHTISKLGYFCAPFRPADGPLSDKVIKVYRGLPDGAALDRLKQCHDDYFDVLRQCGVIIPDTQMHLVTMDGARQPVIVQDALPETSLMRPLMQRASADDALQMMEAAGQAIATFWHGAQKIDSRVGFHPSIRNFAIIDGHAEFFDTFPPLIHYSRDEMGKMLLQFSDKRLMRLVGPLMQKRVTGIQDEW